MEQSKTVRYITQDPLSNLKLQVTLTCLSRASKVRPSAAPAPAAPAPQAVAGQPDHTDLAAAEAAPAESSDAAADTRPLRDGHPAHEKVKVIKWTRVFSWQEKVFSKAEAVAFQKQTSGATGPAAEPGSPSRRQVSIGPFSTLALGAASLVENTADSEGVLFSYIHHDKAAEELEKSKTLTTSATEPKNHLVQTMLHNSRARDKVLNYKNMFIMADLPSTPGSTEAATPAVLVHLKSFADGSFEMTPGFSKADAPGFRFEDGTGRMFEYRLENVSTTKAPLMEGHIANLTKAAAHRTDDQHLLAGRMQFAPLPQGLPTAMRLVVLAEVVAAAGFQRDNLYVDFTVSYNPSVWTLEDAHGYMRETLADDDQDIPTHAIIQGSTQVSKMRKYPANSADGTPEQWVAHFAHPIELEFVAQDTPATSQWPIMLFKVMTYDSWDRYTCEGYGWMPLAAHCPGTGTHYVKAWQPEGSHKDKVQAFFIGGSPELEDISYLAYPSGWKGVPLDKYGFKTITTGTIKVRINSMVQQHQDNHVPDQGPTRTATLKPWRSSLPKQDPSLAVVLERARSRLVESRSVGNLLQQRGGTLTVAVTKDPAGASVAEGDVAELSIEAAGVLPLSYQWYKDNKQLHVATADSPTLLMASVSVHDSGSYHCRVSNTSGSEDSEHAQLVVRRLARLGSQALSSPLRADSDGQQRPVTPTRRSSLLSTSLSPSASALGRIRTSRVEQTARTPPQTGVASVEMTSSPAAETEQGSR